MMTASLATARYYEAAGYGHALSTAFNVAWDSLTTLENWVEHGTTPPPQTLEASGRADSQLTRRLRDALHRGLAHLQWGQVLLASVGSTAPFVGLFGTVWGIYHALAGMAAAGSISIEKVSGPIGESLIMTAAGIAVAVPAVLAYNVFGKWVAACEAELEGFAHDLRELALDQVR